MPPNVLLIILDSVRAQNTSLHGHHHQTTPFLEEFASEATNYTHARSPSDGSQQSHASIFTGLHPEEHGCFNRSVTLEAGHSIWEELQDEGFDTGVFSTNPYLSHLDLGLRHGFEAIVGDGSITRQTFPFPEAPNPQSANTGNIRAYFDHLRETDHMAKGLVNGVSEKFFHPREKLVRTAGRWVPDVLKIQPEGNVVTSQYVDWVDNRLDPWAACINLMDAHSPWFPGPEHDLFTDVDHDLFNVQNRTAPSQFNRVVEYKYGDWDIDDWASLERLYDGGIHKVDSLVREVITALRHRGELDETLVVITSDHGEGFGESGSLRGDRYVSHGGTVDTELTHVPLVVQFPYQSTANEIRSVATLRQFPAAVRVALENDANADTGVFVPENRVTASAQFNRGPAVDALKDQYGSSKIEENTGIERIVVWREADTVHQVRGWLPNGEPNDMEVVTERVLSSGDKKVIAHDGAEQLIEAYDGISREGATKRTSSKIDDETADRLRELGYL